MKVSLIAVTQPVRNQGFTTADELLVYTARVSSPSNQDNHSTGARLLRYCIEHKHWSIFETASMTVEIETSLAIATQILRHRSFTFQMFSQRYAEVSRLGDLFEPIELRLKGSTNRQGSVEGVVPDNLQGGIHDIQVTLASTYKQLLEAGIAPECARFVLPQCTRTRLYMTGNVRSWIHYLQQRCDPHTQKEHREVANIIKSIFADTFPQTFEAVKELIPA